VSDAVENLYRTYIGLPPTDPDAPKIDTGPFRKRNSYRPAEIVLRQTDPTNFNLEEPFRFIGADGNARWTVPARDVSDLASVPQFLTWLVPRYGRHTLAALLHDHLQDSTIPNPVTSREADDVFRNAMADTAVPLLLRWLMWSAVSARTRVKSGGIGMVATLGWLGLYGLVGCFGLPATVLAVCAGWWPLGTGLLVGGGVLASPFILGALWRKGYRFAVFSALGVVTIGYAALLDVLVYGLYAGLETASRLFQRNPRPIRAEKLKAQQLAASQT
jgi:hypothetical protein